MANENFIEKLAAGFSQSATVKNVFGEPIQSGDRTILPVACIAYGLGGGYGQGKPKKMAAATEASAENGGEGAGGGGGMSAKPRGVYEITATGTRFIPAWNGRELVMGIAIGFLLKALLFSCRRKR